MARAKDLEYILAIHLSVIFILASGNVSVNTIRDGDTRHEGIIRETNNANGNVLNLRHLIPFTKGVKLTLHGKDIDLTRVTLDKSNVSTVERILRGRTFTELMYVAVKLAAIERDVAAVYNQPIDSVALEDLFDGEDTVLHIEDVDEIMRQIEDNPAILHLSHPSYYDKGKRVKRKATSRQDSLWPNIILFKISSDFDNDTEYTDVIRDGIINWENETCLVFTDITGDNDFSGSHMVFKDEPGCFSEYVGRAPGSIPQTVSIGRDSNCGTVGIVAHEIGHALGFQHEHIRPDRDEFVRIHEDNVQAGKLHNFLKKSWQDVYTFGIPYDYSSVMHYSPKLFAIDTSANTITVLEEGLEKVPGSQLHLSFYDSKLANFMYCSDQCPEGLVWSACENDGYRDPKNCTSCRCPDGWTGSRCTELEEPVNADCGAKDLTATTSWQTINSPSFNPSTGFDATHCTWRIKISNQYRRVTLKVDALTIVEAGTLQCYVICKDFLEVRNKLSSRSGQRFCCQDVPTDDIISHGSEMLVLLRTRSWPTFNKFTLKYKLEECGCTSNTSAMSAPACLESQYYDCNATYTDCSTGTCLTKIRPNTCLREMGICCNGFRLEGDLCYRTTEDEILGFNSELTYSDGTRWILVAVYILLFILGFCGNAFVVGIILKFNFLRTRLNMFLVNLAVNDMLIVAYIFPFSISTLIYKTYPVSALWCKVNHCVLRHLCSTEMCTITIIAISRYMHVCKENHSVKCFTKVNTTLLCLCPWVIGVLSNIEIFMGLSKWIYLPNWQMCFVDVRSSPAAEGTFACILLLLLLFCLILHVKTYIASPKNDSIGSKFPSSFVIFIFTIVLLVPGIVQRFFFTDANGAIQTIVSTMHALNFSINVIVYGVLNRSVLMGIKQVGPEIILVKEKPTQA